MKVEIVPIAAVKPYDRNPRRNEEAVDKVTASLRSFGWRQPIVVDAAMVIIAGHTRYLAAKRLGMADVPVHIARNLTPEQVRLYRIADNRTAEESAWDEDLLRIEVADLAALGADIASTGFTAAELNALADLGGSLTVHEVETSEIADTFFVTVSGPLTAQADVLTQIKVLMTEMPAVTVDVGVVKRDAPGE